MAKKTKKKPFEELITQFQYLEGVMFRTNRSAMTDEMIRAGWKYLSKISKVSIGGKNVK